MNVTLRKKSLSDNKIRLYLDIYNPNNGHKPRKKESLGLYIFEKPKTANEKTHNKETLQLAEAERARRQLALQNGESGFKDKKVLQGNFLDYFRKLTEERKSSLGNYGNWDSTYKHLKQYFGNHLAFNALNEEQLEGFKKYLLSKVSKNSACSYFGKTKAAINKAFDQKILNENPGKRVKGVKAELTNRQFLTQEELQKLFGTECADEQLKRAFLFSSLTGLRWSDVVKLKWSEIHSDKSVGHYIQYIQKKTGKQESLPMSNIALELLKDRTDSNKKVFPGLVYNAWNNLKIQKWVMKAGIEKDITFHCARHTYATLMLSKDVNIFTVSKLLGHSELKTTQIYTRVLDLAKINAVGELDKLNFKLK